MQEESRTGWPGRCVGEVWHGASLDRLDYRRGVTGELRIMSKSADAASL
jgi:hypothetical protein